MFEYEDTAVTESAVGGLNGLALGDMKLSVNRLPLSMAAVLLKPQEQQVSSNLDSITSGSVMRTASSLTRSTVLRLANMATKGDLTDDQLYEVL